MIINHLLLKLKDRSAEQIEHTRSVLLGMKGKIDVLVDIQAEVNVRPGPSGYDLILITKFESMADLDKYLAHPAHLDVARFIGSVLDTQASVCCEV
ncbi:stress protein [Paenibacillus yonginensis]|uniref:Stress protein n=1 Tax=Paenibacillus yonginensis TaxID=1462996 RepID=A0A1B1MZZ1_9BACL|nr:Dabb family protein [Paenibacillus yonginensis]ANS74726.1 stress protein [Paenibacillus yonginensis]